MNELRHGLLACGGKLFIAIFERLHNRVFSAAEFRAKAVHYADHPLHPEFIEVIKDPIFRQKRVWHDFDYVGVDKISREEARERYRSMAPPVG